MPDLFNTTIVLVCIFGIWFGGNTYLRLEDLNKQFTLTLDELFRDAYAVSEKCEEGVRTIVLSNATSSISYVVASDSEVVTISLFFHDSEKSGANNTRVLRARGKQGAYAPIRYTRENRLMGRLLYFQQGVSRLPSTHRHVDQMIVRIMHHHAHHTTTAPTL